MTKQIPDRLIYKGKTYPQEDELLSHYMYENNIEPEIPDVSSALWRGYMAKFEIIENELFLTGLDVMDNQYQGAFVKQAFPEGLPRKLDFISCLIVLYEGWVEGDTRFPKSYSTWQHYEVLEITNGNLIGSKIFNHQEVEVFKEEQYKRYLLTNEYSIKKQAAIGEKQKAAQKYPWMSFDEASFNEDIKKHILHVIERFY